MYTKLGARWVGAVAGENTSVLLQVRHQVGLCFPQGVEEQVLAGQVPGWSEAEELPHLVWTGGLCSNCLILFLIQHFAIQDVEDTVDVCDPGNEGLPVLVNEVCWGQKSEQC